MTSATGAELRVERTLDAANALLAGGEWRLAGTYFEERIGARFVLVRDLPATLPALTDAQSFLADLAVSAHAKSASQMFFVRHPLGLEIWFTIQGQPERQGRLDVASQAELLSYLYGVVGARGREDVVLAGTAHFEVGDQEVSVEVLAKTQFVFSVDLLGLGIVFERPEG